MKLHVLFGQRNNYYPGQHGLEALACFTEYDADINPSYMTEALERYRKNDCFEALDIVTINCLEKEIMKILFPEKKPVMGHILGMDNPSLSEDSDGDE